MPSDINQEILDRIDESDVTGNVKNFIKAALKLEHKLSDQSRPAVKKDYEKMIKKYNK